MLMQCIATWFSLRFYLSRVAKWLSYYISWIIIHCTHFALGTFSSTFNAMFSSCRSDAILIKLNALDKKFSVLSKNWDCTPDQHICSRKVMEMYGQLYVLKYSCTVIQHYVVYIGGACALRVFIIVVLLILYSERMPHNVVHSLSKYPVTCNV